MDKCLVFKLSYLAYSSSAGILPNTAYLGPVLNHFHVGILTFKESFQKYLYNSALHTRTY